MLLCWWLPAQVPSHPSICTYSRLPGKVQRSHRLFFKQGPRESERDEGRKGGSSCSRHQTTTAANNGKKSEYYERRDRWEQTYRDKLKPGTLQFMSRTFDPRMPRGWLWCKLHHQANFKSCFPFKSLNRKIYNSLFTGKVCITSKNP